MKRIISAVIALTLLTSLGLAGASCVPIVEAKTGTIEVWVTDAPPGYEITSIMVTVSEEGVEIHKAVAEQEQEQEQEGEGEQEQEQQQEQQGEGEWIPIAIIEDNNPFDLTQLQDGLQQILAIEKVSTGKYTQIRMNIEMVEVTFLNEGETEETTVEAKLPSGKLKFVRPFDVVEEETTVLLLDFDVDKSVVFTGSGKVIVKPVVKLTIQQGKAHQLASVEGTISAVDTEKSTLSITPSGETDPIVLNVNPQTEITLDGNPVTLNDLTGLGEGNSVTASYYLNNLKATQINAQPSSE